MDGAKSIEAVFRRARMSGDMVFVPLVIPNYPSTRTFAQLKHSLRSLRIPIVETICALSPSFSRETGPQVRVVASGHGAVTPAYLAAKLGAGVLKVCVVFGKLAGNELDNVVGRFAAHFEALILDGIELSPQRRRALSRRFGVAIIPTISVWASESEIRRAVRGARGYVYLMCAAATGEVRASSRQMKAAIRRIRRWTPLAICCGFGMRGRADIRAARAAGADAVVVGSALLTVLKKPADQWQRFVKEIAGACQREI